MSDPTDSGRGSDGAVGAVLDGNVAAGVLSEMFTVELTAAIAWCAGCGRGAALADTVSYVEAPGLVLRCRGCEHVMVRLVVGPQRRWLDLSGVTVLEMAAR
jgi:hypothetical protein